MKYGYARVSTDDQNPALQLAALEKAGCKTVFKDDGISGATTKRPALLRCLKKLEHGDTLIVWKLDRLGRSLRDLITMLDALKHRGVKFRSLTEAIDTETPTGRAMWQMIGVLAESRTQPYRRANPRRSEGGAAPGREIRKQAKTHTAADNTCPEVDRRWRAPRRRGRTPERGPHHPVLDAQCLTTLMGHFPITHFKTAIPSAGPD
jgi:DNA invertase Pin-like site-specific DNA recombinase